MFTALWQFNLKKSIWIWISMMRHVSCHQTSNLLLQLHITYLLNALPHRWHALQEHSARHCGRNKLLHRVSAVERPGGYRGECQSSTTQCASLDYLCLSRNLPHQVAHLYTPPMMGWSLTSRDTKSRALEQQAGSWSWRNWEERSCTDNWWRWTQKWLPCCTPITNARLRGDQAGVCVVHDIYVEQCGRFPV